MAVGNNEGDKAIAIPSMEILYILPPQRTLLHLPQQTTSLISAAPIAFELTGAILFDC
jgi:hypothetical protein